MNAGVPGPVFMALVATIFSYLISYIAYRGAVGSTIDSSSSSSRAGIRQKRAVREPPLPGYVVGSGLVGAVREPPVLGR